MAKAIEVADALEAGAADGDLRAVRLWLRALVDGPLEPGAPPEDTLRWLSKANRYVELRAWRDRVKASGESLPLAGALCVLRATNPRSRRYLRKALVAVERGRRLFGLTVAEGRALMHEAWAERWHVKHGLEYRFLVAYLKAPGAVALDELRPADFLSVPYSALLALLQAHGAGALDVRALLEDRGHVPPLPASWWEAEARATFAELLARRERKAERPRTGSSCATPHAGAAGSRPGRPPVG